MRATSVRCCAAAIHARIGAVQPIDIRQQHQRIRLHHLRHARGQPVIVAETDFLGRHRIVFVHDGNGPEIEQGAQGVAGIQIAAAVFAVFRRQQNLRHGLFAERFAPQAHQLNLPDGGEGLLLLQPQCIRAGELAAGEGHRAAGDQNHFGALGAQRLHIFGQGGKPGGPGPGIVHHQIRADLDDEALRAHPAHG